MTANLLDRSKSSLISLNSNYKAHYLLKLEVVFKNNESIADLNESSDMNFRKIPDKISVMECNLNKNANYKLKTLQNCTQK